MQRVNARTAHTMRWLRQKSERENGVG